MDHPRKKRTKAGHDGAGTSKRGRKSIAGHRAPPQDSPPSDHHEDEELEPLKMHEPKETGNQVFIKYSKKTALTTFTENHEAMVYSG
jgi:hypothetical protein